MTRRNFTPKTKGLIRERSGGQCEVHLVPRCMYPALPETCKRQGAEVDHITPAYVDGPPTVENGAFLCGLCHKLKTVTDNKEAKKSNRLQGRTQADRRAQRGPTMQSRGFDRTWKKRMDGTTVRRDA
jgi:5-methylcytosine-specific restriction endonuclease McrA